jgi:hypothetical protein
MIMEKENKTFKIELDETTIRNLLTLINNTNNPFLPLELWRLGRLLQDIIDLLIKMLKLKN